MLFLSSSPLFFFFFFFFSSLLQLFLLFFFFNQLEQKMVNEFAVVCANESRMFSRVEIKRSSSESDFDIEEFLSKAIVGPEENDTNKANNVVGVSASEFCGLTDERFQESDVFFGDDCSAAPLKNPEIKTVLFRRGRLSEPLWSQNLTPKHSSISGTLDSQSSVCVGSPASANQPTGQSNQGANSRSSHEQSDDEDVEIELGPCEQSGDPVNLKRIRRKISNRNSARRSRQRKQAHLTELECQVVNLQEENASLFKHLTDASQQYRDANTNNRVLKSGVEALRAKVKLAEDMIARGSLTHSLNQLLQNHLSKTTEPLNTLRTMSNVSPTINLHGDGVSYAGTMTSGHRLGGRDMSNMIENLKSSIGSDDLSDFWA